MVAGCLVLFPVEVFAIDDFPILTLVHQGVNLDNSKLMQINPIFRLIDKKWITRGFPRNIFNQNVVRALLRIPNISQKPNFFKTLKGVSVCVLSLYCSAKIGQSPLVSSKTSLYSLLFSIKNSQEKNQYLNAEFFSNWEYNLYYGMDISRIEHPRERSGLTFVRYKTHC